MQKFAITGRAQTADGLTLVAPDGAYIETWVTAEASNVATAINRAVQGMSARFDKVMQRHYKSVPRLAVNDRLIIEVRRVS